jgi:mannose-6-phosphate isomerase-like protein (cupin superfamily)
MSIQKVNLEEKFDSFQEYWTPKIAGELNEQHIKLAKFKGDFVMHQHEKEDEMFLVIEGHLQIELENETIELNPGEFVIIPKGTLHKPIAKEEVQVLLMEPKFTLNTGDQEGDLTVKDLEKI